MDEELMEGALKNLEHYLKKNPKGKGKIHFYHGMAQDYAIHPMENRFYFFNPFSLQIFMIVVNHILMSMENNYRDIELILYYPSDEYTHYLDQQTPFELHKEVRLSKGYQKNPFEKFLIYRLMY